MSYKETLHWMFAQLPMYQHQGKAAYKADLSNTLILTDYLDHPETGFKSVHVAGTNGKGSTSHMIASVLQEAGYKVGLYTSPHLKDFRERIKINGEPVSKGYVMDFIAKHKSFFESHALSFFEMTVGMAFQYFKEQNVDIAIIEVGMGGRLDSTNIITPEVSVITNIGFDHMQFLGDTLEKIAEEKGGIIKPGVPVVIGETQKETAPVFNRIAKEKNVEIKFADAMEYATYISDLKGIYQAKNIKTAVQTLYELRRNGWGISDEAIEKGLSHVVKNTGLLGRWQVLQQQPLAICDTAHNKEGLTYVMQQLETLNAKSLHLVIGVVNDKDLSRIIPLFPKTAHYYFCRPNIPRGLDAEILKNEFLKYGFHGNTYSSVNEAYKMALEKASNEDVIFVGGSTFVVAEII
ncbi:bifunctional folylpolyglutamate synthase/dihydrofolate synthase [Gaetbulibacter aestuarii]|uniref:Dihydrofolate synthase/folylpolyglutamate synthase n=1 Tax=Gaetbulibacter aestuarii TaxID=1502358 RepID=A0ABW7MZE7_9FLAO